MIHFIYNLSIFAKLDKVKLPTGCILSTLNLPLVYAFGIITDKINGGF